MKKTSSIFLLLSLMVCISCEDDVMENPQVKDCNEQLLPLVLVHGFLASGDTYTLQEMRFTSNDYCIDRIFTFDWNSLASIDHTGDLDAFIDEVLSQTGAEKVNLAGHSAGGGLCYSYLDNPAHASKVAAYAHIAASEQVGPAGPFADIPTMNIWSQDDEVVAGANIPGVRNVVLSGADHYQVATNAETFDSLYAFFNSNQLPITNQVVEETAISISGRALSFGENAPVNNGTVEIYALDPSTGFSVNEQADASLITDEEGYWGPFNAETDTYYEFKVIKDEGSRPVHYYLEPFKRSSGKIYLRTLPSSGSLAGLILSQLPSDDDQSVIAVFSSNQAVISGRDVLSIEGVTLSTPELASAASTSIAFFLYDDGDAVSSEEPISLFTAFPFVTGLDLFFQAASQMTITAEFNGKQIKMRNWPSASEGPVVAVFD